MSYKQSFTTVYVLENRLNGDAYVGVTETSISRRWECHRSAAKRGSKFRVHAAMREAGIENFEATPIAIVGSKAEGYLEENYWVERLASFGVKILNDGLGEPGNYGAKRSHEFCRNLGKRTKALFTGRPSPLKGRRMSDAARQKMSLSAKTRAQTEEGRLNLLAARERLASRRPK